MQKELGAHDLSGFGQGGFGFWPVAHASLGDGFPLEHNDVVG